MELHSFLTSLTLAAFTPAWVEGTNEEIERTAKYIGFFDEKKPKKTKKVKKPVKKVGGTKKKK